MTIPPQANEGSISGRRAVARERLQILHQVEKALELPMAVLGAAWLGLTIFDLVSGLSRFGQNIATAIWIAFIIDFALRLLLAPRKLRYLRRNWLTAIALFLPALRIFRFARIFRMLSRMRGVSLVRILGSVNRGMRALGKAMQRRGIGYVLALTLIVTFAGAAGMLSFEKNLPDGRGLNDYWTALWWTAMIMTTMGSEYWPRTPEGRTLCLLLAIYAFTMFGYMTGAIATLFIGRDAAADDSSTTDEQGIADLKNEVRALREELRAAIERKS